jgi:hypothetical protein
MKWSVFRRRRGILTEHTFNAWLKARQIVTSTDLVDLCHSISVEPPTPPTLHDIFHSVHEVPHAHLVDIASQNDHHDDHRDLVRDGCGSEMLQGQDDVTLHNHQTHVTVDRRERKPRKNKDASPVVDPQDH